MMRFGIVVAGFQAGEIQAPRRVVALNAQRVALGDQASGMGFVAIAASHALGMHAALQEGAVNIHLVQNLPIRLVQARFQQRRQVVIEQRAVRAEAFGQLGAAAVAGGAAIELLGLGIQPQQTEPIACAGFPGRGGCFASGAPAGRRGGAGRWAGRRCRNALRPGDMVRGRPVAGLAAHRHLRELGLIDAALRVVSLSHRGGVAVRAHEVPVVAQPGPVQRVASGDVFLRVQVKPALADRIPSDVQGLQPPARQFQQVLLQGLRAEDIAHLELGQGAVRTIRGHQEAPLPLLEAGANPCLGAGRGDGCAGEIPGDGIRRHRQHGPLMMGAQPSLVGLGVAGCAACGTRIFRGRRNLGAVAARQRPKRPTVALRAAGVGRVSAAGQPACSAKGRDDRDGF